MARRVALVGGECTGKSTLADALAVAVSGVVVPEALRQWCLDHGRTPEQSEQQVIMGMQVVAESAVTGTDVEWIVCDPATLMTAVYSQIYFDDDTLMAPALEHANTTYDGIIWCDRDVPWHSDAHLRDGTKWRDLAHEVLADALAHLDIPVLRVSGALDSRVECALAFLKGLHAD